jgi:hypothetical protein
MLVVDQESYQAAAEFLVGVKGRAKQVTEYWAGPKEKAHAAHRDIVAKEKAMLQPLKDAETVIKGAMAVYQREVERERMRMEAEARRKQQEERDRLLAQAIEAQESGDHMCANVSLAMAEMVEDMPAASVSAPAPKAAGISMRMAWKARVINPAIVPVSVIGVEIRPIDMRALEGIARLTKGTAAIPGVEFYEDSIISARA